MTAGASGAGDHGSVRRRAVCVNCSDPIVRCSCGGSACPGWHHPGDWGGHWCQHDKGKATPNVISAQ